MLPRTFEEVAVFLLYSVLLQLFLSLLATRLYDLYYKKNAHPEADCKILRPTAFLHGAILNKL